MGLELILLCYLELFSSQIDHKVMLLQIDHKFILITNFKVESNTT